MNERLFYLVIIAFKFVEILYTLENEQGEKKRASYKYFKPFSIYAFW